jgi:chemotaxis protein CheX
MAGILSTHFNGNLVIGFTEDNFKKSMTQFLLMEVTELTGEILDGAAELLNVIIGQTKIKLNEKGFEIKQVIPSVITGEKIKINPVASHRAILIDYESTAGNFFILLSTNKSHL